MNAPANTPTFMTSREFNQDTAKAKRAAAKGPVFITTRGQPSHVLMTKEAFDRLEKEEASEKPSNLADALAQTEGGDFDYEFPEFKDSFSFKVPDLE